VGLSKHADGWLEAPARGPACRDAASVGENRSRDRRCCLPRANTRPSRTLSVLRARPESTAIPAPAFAIAEQSPTGHAGNRRRDHHADRGATRHPARVFNACETGTGFSGALDFASGVAPALVAAGVPAVVANQFPVLDPSATAFARHFYWSLAHGRSIGDAAREARVAVNYLIAGEAIDWAVPVVFARNPYESLVIAPASASTASTADAVRNAVRQTRRRGARRQGFAVAVWDVNHVVPGLEALIGRMNVLQDYVRFDLADITAPIGTWRRLRTVGIAGSRGGRRRSGASTMIMRAVESLLQNAAP
jgi:CHAT domain